MKRSIKSNIRETSVNKLTLFSILMQKIIDGYEITAERACLAKKEIKEMLTWLEKKSKSHRSIRKQGIDKLKYFENILDQIIENKPVSIAEAQMAMKNIGQITNWLDERGYRTFSGEKMLEESINFKKFL